MTKPRMLALIVVVTHWMVAVWQLFLAAKVLPPPNHNVGWLANSELRATSSYQLRCGSSATNLPPCHINFLSGYAGCRPL